MNVPKHKRIVQVVHFIHAQTVRHDFDAHTLLHSVVPTHVVAFTRGT